MFESICVGTEFANFKALEAAIEQFQLKNCVQLHVRSSRTLESAQKRAPKRFFAENLGFTEVDYACSHGGRKLKFKSTTGQRPYQHSFLRECPFFIQIRTNREGTALYVRNMVADHNHDTNKNVDSQDDVKSICGDDQSDRSTSSLVANSNTNAKVPEPSPSPSSTPAAMGTKRKILKCLATKRKRAFKEDKLLLMAYQKLNDSNTDAAKNEFDCFGQTVAHALSNMPREQIIHAKKLISDVLYEGQLSNLSRASVFLPVPDKGKNAGP